MTTSIDPALVARLSGEFDSLAGEFTALGGQMNTLGRDLASLHRQVQSVASARTDSPGTAASPRPVPGESDLPECATTGTGHQPGGVAAGIGHATEQTAASSGAPPGRVPSSGVGVGGVHTPAQPDPASSAGEAASGAGAAPPAPATTATPANTHAQPAPEPRAPWTQPPGAAWQHGRPTTTAGMYRHAMSQVPPPRTTPPPRGPVPPRGDVPGSGPPSPPWWQREGVISRLLAVAGVAVTLIGVVMLLVLAAQAGIFGPVPRVVAGGVLSVALVGAGMRVFRRPGGRVGAIALAATGFAGAYLDIVAMTTIYDWLHPVPGFAAALGIAAAGVGLAVQWRSQPLAVLVVAGAAVLAPFVTTELALLAFLIVLQVTCVPVQMRYDWPFLHLVRTVPAVLAIHLTILAFVIEQPGDRRTLVLAAATAVAAAGLVGAILVTRQRPGDLVASLTCALAITPLLAAPALVDRPAATILSAGYAVVLLAVAATALVPKLRDIARIPGHTAIVAGTGGSFAALEAVWGVTTGSTLPFGLLLVAACYLGVAGQARNRVAALFGSCYAVLGGIGLFTVADPETLSVSRRAVEELSAPTAAAAIAGLGVLAVALWTLRRIFGTTTDESVITLLWIGASGAALYLVTTAAVALGVAAGAADGFIVGHCVSTIVWMAAALAALLYGLRHLGAEASATVKVALGSGLLVTAAALAKLFLFDLATLDGLIRVAAFLMVGILLLVAGTRYARAFAETGSRESGAA
ncbi:DUF2339 domain-containing protein [Nocardia carnea]|uniref:DUF2339 domain-containing protein n=1 Tax=Nocardia carnea TaxID=37328 RepID=UPI0024544011|nr:DUF2339 domain-containing protein [Nocardia carnea]